MGLLKKLLKNKKSKTTNNNSNINVSKPKPKPVNNKPIVNTDKPKPVTNKTKSDISTIATNKELEDIIQREEEHDNKCYRVQGYYHSDEAKTIGKQIYEDKKEYVKNNPEDYLIVGAQIHSRFWYTLKDMPKDEMEIFILTGKGKYYEDKEEYEKAIEIYKEAEDLTMETIGDEIEEAIREHGEGDYLYLAPIRRRMRVCEKKVFRSKIKKLEAEAKELEKTNPEEAIKKYEYLNEVNPNLKKYNKRIEILKKKL